MAQIQIDADALYRAVTATGYKLMAYHLDMVTGEILSRTLRPDEIVEGPQAPSVKPLPKMGGDLSPKKDVNPFGSAPASSASKKKLFADDGPKKSAFENDFFKRDDKKKVDPFGEGGFKKESGTKKLAEMFSEPPPKKAVDPFFKPGEPAEATAAPAFAAALPTGVVLDPESHPRIPVATEAQQAEWRARFAKDCGDPQIKEELQHTQNAPKPAEAFERALRKYARMGQQWENYHRKRGIELAESWLRTLPVTWEIVEKPAQ